MLFCVNKNQGTGLTVFRQTFVLDDWHSNIRIWLGLIKKWVCFHCMEKLHRFTISPDKWETLVEKLTISIKKLLKWAGKSWWFSARRGNNFETKLDPIFSIFLKIYSLGFSRLFSPSTICCSDMPIHHGARLSDPPSRAVVFCGI